MGIVTDNKVLADELSHYSRLCYDRHLVGAAGGNLSVRVPGTDSFLITASGVALRDVTMENIVVIDGGGNLVEAPPSLRASKEINFHLAIYNIKPEVNAVVHVHPTFTTVYASARREIPLITVSSKLKVKQGFIVPEAAPGSKELCDEIIQAVKESPSETTVLLMERHGLVAYRSKLCDAFDDAELVEDTAKIDYMSSQLKREHLKGVENGRQIDLTAVLNEKIQRYPKDPPFRRSWHTEFDKDGMCVSKLQMGAHVGTHVDAPLHSLEEGASVAMMAPELFYGQAIAINAPKQSGENITVEDILNSDIRKNDIVLFRTGWEERSGSPEFFKDEWPGFAPDLIDVLISKGIKAVGGDIPSADSPGAIANGASAHKRAGRVGLPVFEALVNLKEVIGRRFFFIGLPLKIEGCEASPIRAIAILD